MRAITHLRHRSAREDGFTMAVTLLALVVSSLLVAAALGAVVGDIRLSSKSTAHQKAYYASAAGVERYLQELDKNPNYWVKCPSIAVRKVPNGEVAGAEKSEEEYKVQTLPAAGYSKCIENVQASVLETSGAARGTFRILIEATAGTGSSKTTHKIVATFSHPGFTKYVYETNYEVEDPSNFSPEPTNCEHYYKERKEKKLTSVCPPIQFASEDKVNGPMHTNDAADICASSSSKPVFGRKGREDAVEMLQGHYSEGTCKNEPNILGKYTETAESLLPPETDAELLETAGAKYSGRTEIELKAGTPNLMKVTNNKETKTVGFPKNGVVFVENSSEGCAVAKYSPFNSDTTDDTGCGNVYVHGTYTESLTIASADDVIVNGNLTTTGGTEGGEPTGGAELGLIAENFVRVYHPVKQGYELAHYAPEQALQAPVGTTKCGTLLERSGTYTTSTKKEITLTSGTTSGLSVGEEVTGAELPSGTTIKAIKSSTVLEISQTPKRNETKVALTFFKASGFEYYSGIKKCVEKAKTGYTFHETETLFVKGSCESGTTNGGENFCEYENDSGGCSSKATNLSASEDPNKWGAMSDPVIDAAILSTKHSWIVDNYKCGAQLGNLTVWGSIAQFWRGPVGTSGGSGYIKDYNYDQRLFTQEPPNFLSPISTAWKLSRESEVSNSFTG